MTNPNTLARERGDSTLVWPKFGAGMLLQHEDLEQANTYTRELNRLLFRSLFGCGVVCGLVVSVREHCGQLMITVGAGVALDCKGDAIHVPTPVDFPLDDACGEKISGVEHMWVLLCGVTKTCAPRSAMCADDDSDDAPPLYTRVRAGYEIRVVTSPPSCVCRKQPSDCDPCASTGCGNCECECVLLAQLNKIDNLQWTSSHLERRFVRPVILDDPQVKCETQKVQVEPAESQSSPALPGEDVTEPASIGARTSASESSRAKKAPRPRSGRAGGGG
jgi:hypothetical protein